MDANLTFGFADERSRQSSLLTAGSVARSWCDPSAFSEVVGIDFGKGEMHLHSLSTGRNEKVSAETCVQRLMRLDRGTLAVCEPAHLAVPRTARSLAQPLTADELLALYEGLRRRGVTLKLFPHSHTGTRASSWAAANFPGIASGEKTDANDAMAIALYVRHCNGVSLADPPMSFARCSKRDYGIAVAGYANIVLNAERTTEYKGKFFPEVVKLGHAICRKVGRRLKPLATISIASLIATEIDGVPVMFVRNGRPAGAWLWARHVMRMTPFHHRAGIARSNVMRHSFRPYLKRHGRMLGVDLGKGSKCIPFGQHDQRQTEARADAMRAFRNAILEAYRRGVEIAEARGFEKFDPMTREAKDGTHPQ